ncbi:hypothetical protein KC19_6G007700 [Ceratodon purpureus]|uniref:Uncharacterized protein n=1 Tax=Ceratodon purpureus TaxID=3225 RepID=A0A8T0HC77_CERPU|nr:hypothetical protein KC19_6G007700 [Ceratodon purpureus]
MICMILLVWENLRGFTEVPDGAIIAPESPQTASNGNLGLGLGGDKPNTNSIVLAFVQPNPPFGPTYLRVDFWKDTYLQPEFAKLMILSVVDTPILPIGAIRTMSSWRKQGMSWNCMGAYTGAKVLDDGYSMHLIVDK